MAHEFSIERKANESKAFFNGYVHGICYKTFNSKQFDAGMSGSDDGKSISKYEAIKGLVTIIRHVRTQYTDPDRAEDLENFLEQQVRIAHDDEEFEVWFS